MTLPSERRRSISNTREFLRKLLNPRETPRVPKAVRKEAYWCLRHFPSVLDMKRAAKNYFDTFDDPEDPPEDPNIP